LPTPRPAGEDAPLYCAKNEWRRRDAGRTGIKKRSSGWAPASSIPKQLAARARADAELRSPVIKAEDITGGRIGMSPGERQI
jgi:hypothetical protein